MICKKCGKTKPEKGTTFFGGVCNCGDSEVFG